MKAMNTVACKATGKQFSSTVLRYLCSWSLDVFCEAAVQQLMVYESPDATEKEKPVTWCTEVKNTIQEAENEPVDCKLVHQCTQVKAKLESEIELGKAMQVQVITNLEEFGGVHESLTRAIEDAERKNADT